MKELIQTLPSKRSSRSYFSSKAKEKSHHSLVFNSASVSVSSSSKHVGVLLDTKLIFDKHVKMVSSKINKTLGLLRKLKNLLQNIRANYNI